MNSKRFKSILFLLRYVPVSSTTGKTDGSMFWSKILLKILCHNICVVIQEMYELGISPDFN